MRDRFDARILEHSRDARGSDGPELSLLITCQPLKQVNSGSHGWPRESLRMYDKLL
jgi:hypothetical protein